MRACRRAIQRQRAADGRRRLAAPGVCDGAFATRAQASAAGFVASGVPVPGDCGRRWGSAVPQGVLRSFCDPPACGGAVSTILGGRLGILRRHDQAQCRLKYSSTFRSRGRSWFSEDINFLEVCEVGPASLKGWLSIVLAFFKIDGNAPSSELLGVISVGTFLLFTVEHRGLDLRVDVVENEVGGMFANTVTLVCTQASSDFTESSTCRLILQTALDRNIGNANYTQITTDAALFSCFTHFFNFQFNNSKWSIG